MLPNRPICILHKALGLEKLIRTQSSKSFEKIPNIERAFPIPGKSEIRHTHSFDEKSIHSLLSFTSNSDSYASIHRFSLYTQINSILFFKNLHFIHVTSYSSEIQG